MIGIVAALAIALAIAKLVVWTRIHPVSFDGAMNLEVARSLAEGHGYGRLYENRTGFSHEIQSRAPFILPAAAVFSVFGVDVWQSQLTNLVYVFALALLVFLLVRRWISPLPGLAAAALCLWTPGLGEIGLNGYGEVPALVWWLAALLVLCRTGEARAGSWRVFGAGVLVGMAILTKTVLAIGLIAIVPVLVAVSMTRESRFRSLAIALVAFAAGVLTPLVSYELAHVAALGDVHRWRAWLDDEVHAIRMQAGAAKGFQIHCRNYNEMDGLQGREFNENAALKTSSGELVMAGANGMNIFNPANIRSNRNHTSIVLTDFQIFNKSIHTGEKVNGKKILSKAISETGEVSLKYNQNVFSLEFASLSFSNTAKYRYAYKLEGFDKDWLVTDGKARKATYTNLDPGVYTFSVKGLNNEGNWSDKVAELKITIAPPFWKTWWFRIFAVSIVVGGIVYAFKVRVSIMQKQKDELEEQVRLRTEEVIRQKETLQAQSEDVQQLNEQLQAQAEFLQGVNVELEKQKEEAENASHLPSFENPWSLFRRYSAGVPIFSRAPPMPLRAMRNRLPPEFTTRYFPSADQLGASKRRSAS